MDNDDIKELGRYIIYVAMILIFIGMFSLSGNIDWNKTLTKMGFEMKPTATQTP